MATQTCCPYCNYVCDDETHKAAANLEGVKYEIISSEPAWIPEVQEWGENAELSPIVVKGSRPSGGVNNALTDSNMPIVIDNVPYTDMAGADYLNAVSAENNAASPNADTVTASVQENAAAENTAQATDTVQAPPAAEAQKHPEETVKSLVGDTASQINTAADLMAKPLEERAQILQRTAELKSELAATYANGMITFQNGEMPADAAGFYARNPGALSETVEAVRTQAESIRKMGGEDAGKAYLFGAAGKLAGGVGNGLDVMELGIRMNKAYHEDTRSNWDSVYGQLSKIMVGAAGGAAAVGVARAAGLIAVGMGAPAIGTLVISIGVGALATYLISTATDFIESEMSKGHFRTETTENHMTDLVLVGDMHVPVDARLHADNVVIFGNQRFDNVDVKADKVEIVGSISSEGNFIVHAEEVSVMPSENVAQTLLEKAQAEAAVQAQKGADSVQSEQVAEVPSERAESVPAETPPVENEAVIGYDSPENILPDGSRIDDELFFYEENLLLQPPVDSAVSANDAVTYADTVQSDIVMPDIYDDYIM